MGIRNKHFWEDTRVKDLVNLRHIDLEDDPCTNVSYASATPGQRFLQLPEVPTASLPAAAAGNEGAVVYNSTTNTVQASDGASWADIGVVGGTGTLNQAYTAGETITLTNADGNLIINCAVPATDECLIVRASATGTQASLVILDAYHATATVTDALMIQATGATGVITDAIDASDAKIVNALNIGANSIAGTNFNVSAAGAIVGVGVNYGAGSLVGTGDIAISTTKFNVTGASGDVSVNGGLFTVTGATGAAKALSLTGLNGSNLAIAASATTNQGATLNGGGSGTVGIGTVSTGAITVGNASVTAVNVVTSGAGTGTLAVTGDMTVTGTLSIAGGLTYAGALIANGGIQMNGALIAMDTDDDSGFRASADNDIDVELDAGTEFSFETTRLDMKGNHLDDCGYVIFNAVTLPGGTEVYAGHDNTGDLTLNCKTGKTVNVAINGTDEYNLSATAIDFLNNAADNVGFLILNAATAPAGTEVYAVNDNTGDLTLNALTGKQVILAINNTDEYTFSATVLDLCANAIDNAGFLILNAATAPAATEVYAVNDNTGDLTLNAVTGKAVHIAIAGVDEFDVNETETVVNEGSGDRNFRVESNGVDPIFICDGGLDGIAFGTTVSTAAFVRVGRNARTLTNNGAWGDLLVSPLGAITAQGTNPVIATVYLAEPNITLNAQTVSLAATVYIASAPTEGTLNSALYIASGSLDTLGAVNIAADATDLTIGASADASLRWSTADADNHALVLALGASKAVHVCDTADIATDWNVAAASNPTLYIHGSATPATEYIALSTDETDAHFNAVGANWSLEIGGTAELTISATAVNLVGNGLCGSAASGGDLVLNSTSHGTKGCVSIADATLGFIIGGVEADGWAAKDNYIYLKDAAAPPAGASGTSGSGIYSAGGELFTIDKTGTATLQTPHDEKKNWIFKSWDTNTGKGVIIHMEKFMKALAKKFPDEFASMVEEFDLNA